MSLSPDIAEPPVAGPPSSQPSARLPDAGKALELIRHSEKKLIHRLEVYKEVVDRYDRMPPDDPELLELDGMSWATNVDWGGMEAEINGSVEPLFHLARQPSVYVDVRSSFNPVNRSVKMGGIVAEEDRDLLNGWDDWDYQLELMLMNRQAMGLGAFLFDDPHGWHFSSIHPGNLVYPENAYLLPDRWPWFAVRTEFNIVDLIRKLEDPDISTKAGWNLSNVRKTISRFAKTGGSSWVATLLRDADYYTQNVRPNDLWFSSINNQTVHGYILFVQEWNGKISQRYLVAQQDNGGEVEIGYLFEDNDKFERMGQIISLFPTSLGFGILSRVRGPGVRMLPFYDTENRLLNHTIDVSHLGSSLILQGRGGQDLARMAEVSIGPISMIPDNVEVQQQSFGNPTQGLLGLKMELERMRSGRAAAFGTGAKPAAQKTLGEARMEYQDSKSLEGFAIQRFYRQLSHFHNQRFRRTWLDKGFTKHCRGYDEYKAAYNKAIERGVDPEFIKNIDRVEAKRVIGNGNPVELFLALSDILPFRGGWSTEGQRLFDSEIITARTGSREMAAEFIGEAEEVDDLSSVQIQHAQLENAVFASSDTRVDVTNTDIDALHLAEHLAFGKDTITMWKAGELPLELVVQRLMRLQPHVQGHLQRHAGNQLEVDLHRAFLRDFADIVNSTRQAAQQLQAQRQKEQEAALSELREPKLPATEQEKVLTEQANRQMMIEKTRAEIQALKERTAAEIAVMKARAQAERSPRNQPQPTGPDGSTRSSGTNA